MRQDSFLATLIDVLGCSLGKIADPDQDSVNDYAGHTARRSNNGASTQGNIEDSGPKSRHIADKVAAAMIVNMMVLSDCEDENRMAVVATPLSIWKHNLPKGLNN